MDDNGMADVELMGGGGLQFFCGNSVLTVNDAKHNAMMIHRSSMDPFDLGLPFGDASEPPPLIAEDDEEMTTHGSNEWATLCRAIEKPCDGIVPSQVQSRGRRVCGVTTGSGDTVEDTLLPWLWKYVHPGLLLARGVQDKEEPMNWLVQTITHYRGMGRIGSTDLTWSHGTAMQQIELLRRGFFPRRDVIKW